MKNGLDRVNQDAIQSVLSKERILGGDIVSDSERIRKLNLEVGERQVSGELRDVLAPQVDVQLDGRCDHGGGHHGTDPLECARGHVIAINEHDVSAARERRPRWCPDKEHGLSRVATRCELCECNW